jgi:hypothetical protein
MMGQSMTTLDRVFSKTHGIPAIYSTMSRDRFKFLLKNLNFDDALDANSRIDRVKKRQDGCHARSIRGSKSEMGFRYGTIRVYDYR